jgi:hypothetical protein
MELIPQVFQIILLWREDLDHLERLNVVEAPKQPHDIEGVDR